MPPPSLPSRKGQSGRLLRRPQRDHHAATVADFCTAVSIGAENSAMLASLVATCKMSGVNPVDYLAATLRAILDGHPKSRIEELMPWRFAQPSSLAA
jgi:hypothetical protein